MRNFCQLIYSCSETNPDGGETGIECILQCRQIEEVLTVKCCVFASPKLGNLELKREYKATLNSVAASNTIASLSSFLPTDFVVYFVVDRLEKSGIDSCVPIIIMAV